MPYKNIAQKRARDRAYWRKIKADGPPPNALPIDVVHDLKIPVSKHGLKIAVITDAQVMPGVPMDHLAHAGMYVAAKKPDVIVCIGDFGDFPSLSKFGRGERDFANHRYAKDIAAFHEGMQLFLGPIDDEIARTAKTDDPWNPYEEFLEGNHESHLDRITQEFPILEGTISKADLCLEEYGWRVHPFMQPVAIGGVAFCHYFPSGVMGKPISSAPALLRKLHMSAFAGHQQGREIAYSRRADGGNLTAIISGSFYQHKYKYLSPFTNAHWRGMYMLHEVKDGQFDEMAVSINFLKRKYG